MANTLPGVPKVFCPVESKTKLHFFIKSVMFCPFANMKSLNLSFFTSDHLNLDGEKFGLKYVAKTKYSLINKVLI